VKWGKCVFWGLSIAVQSSSISENSGKVPQFPWLTECQPDLKHRLRMSKNFFDFSDFFLDKRASESYFAGKEGGQWGQ